MLYASVLIVGLLRGAVWVLLAVTCFAASRQYREHGAPIRGRSAIVAGIGFMLTAPSSVIRAFGDADHPHAHFFLGLYSTVTTLVIAVGIAAMLVGGVEHLTGKPWRPWHF